MTADYVSVRLLVIDRKGRSTYEWSKDQDSVPLPQRVVLAEDAQLSIEIQGDLRGSVLLGDVALSWEREFETENGNPSRVSKLDCHLRNFVGQCPLLLDFGGDGAFTAFLIEVFATKFTAEQVRSILTYLASRDLEVLRLCFSKVSFGTELVGAPASTPELMVQAAERFIEFAMEKREYLRSRYKRRLVPRTDIIPRSNGDAIDDRGLSWILRNLDQLSDGDRSKFDLVVGGRFYNVARCETVRLQDDANVYENQVLLSCIRSIHGTVRELIGTKAAARLKREQALADYVSFAELISEFLPLALSFRERAERVVRGAAHLIVFFERDLGVRVEKNLLVTVNPFVRSNAVYYRLFSMADAWRKCGMPSWAGRDYQAQLISLSKLYEFFCLFMILESLEALGFSIQSRKYVEFKSGGSRFGDETSKPLAEPFNSYRLECRGESLILLYDAKIFSRSLVRESATLVDLASSGRGRFPYRQPDFILVRGNERSGYQYYVIDAKYSSGETAIRQRLPEVVGKYYLNVGVMDERQQFNNACIMGCAVTHVGSSVSVDGVTMMRGRNSDYGISGDRFLLPAFASVLCGPDARTHIREFLKRLLSEWRQRFEILDGVGAQRESELTAVNTNRNFDDLVPALSLEGRV